MFASSESTLKGFFFQHEIFESSQSVSVSKSYVPCLCKCVCFTGICASISQALRPDIYIQEALFSF